MRVTKLFIITSILAVILCSSAFGASKSELKLMSVFVSNFIEVGMSNFEADSLSNDELAHFGIWHNYRNNFKSRIRRCPDKDCPYGSLIIDKKYVAESVKKYFNRNIKHTSTQHEHFDGDFYHFDGADGDNQQARVYEVKREDGIIYMSGETYYPDFEDLEGVPFTAAAKPYKYNGKNTWYILSLETE